MESTFASRVKEFRKFKGLSQEAFAERCGLEQGNITQMERGTDPKSSNAAKIIGAYPDLSSDWLLLGTGPMLRDGRALTPRVVEEPARVSAAGLLALSPPTPEEWRALQRENQELREQLARKEGALVAVEEDRTWLRKQIGGKTEASADAADEDSPLPVMEANRNHDYVPAPAIEQRPYVAAGFVWGR